MRFINGLDSSMPAFHEYKLYLINSKQQTDKDIYPDTLVDAIKKSTLFEASWTANNEPSPLTTLPLNAFGAQGTPGDRRPRGGKTPGKGKGGGKTPDAKDKKDGTDKIGDKTKRRVLQLWQIWPPQSGLQEQGQDRDQTVQQYAV